MSSNQTIRHFIRPTFNRVLIKRAAAQTEIGGIAVPDHSQAKPSEGVIVAVGPGVATAESQRLSMIAYPGMSADPNQILAQKNLRKMTDQVFNIGDYVLFGAYAGKDVTVDANTPDEQTFVELVQDEIIGVVVAVGETPAPTWMGPASPTEAE